MLLQTDYCDYSGIRRLFTSLYPFYCYLCHSIFVNVLKFESDFPLKKPISVLKPFFDGSANDESVQRFLLLFSVSERSSIMPSELENAMESLIKVFHRYAKENQLSRRDLRELMENELSNFLKAQKDPAAVDKIMKDLDANGDGQVDFEEFVSLVVGLSVACEQCYQMEMKKRGKN
uniref:S100 calcium binding protein A10a n=2 Tax=Oryzias sinensis TaxID=183150 RepID=A0A8C7WTI1_9TELE